MARSRWSFKVKRYDGIEEEKEPKKAGENKNPRDSIWTKYEALQFATRGKVFDDWLMYFNVQPHSVTVDNPLDLNERMRLTVNLYSTTFAAQVRWMLTSHCKLILPSYRITRVYLCRKAISYYFQAVIAARFHLKTNTLICQYAR